MVTSQKEQIQSLIADIERVLKASKPRTPWIKASETEPQRQMLAQAQAYLMSLQQLFEAPGGWGPVDPTTGQLETQLKGTQTSDAGIIQSQAVESQAVESPIGSTPVQKVESAADNDAAVEESAEDLLQALRTEMKFLKSSALQPLRLEIDSLQSARGALQQEVEALEAQRSQLNQEIAERTSQAQAEIESVHAARVNGDYLEVDEAQLNQFLAVLMERLQENLSVQVTQTLEQLESDHAAAIATISAAAESEQLALRPSREQQIEEMRQLQSRSDQLLVNIDSTLQRMFETLQSNIDTYQISLNEGIENMHGLGRQGEVIVRSLVDHLTAQLGQTTPPEPAFFSSRQTSALPQSETDAEADSETDAEAGSEADVESAISPAEDTVSSLNEILPDESVSNELLPDEILADERWPVAATSSFDDEEIRAEDILASEALRVPSGTPPSTPPAEDDDDLETAEAEPETFIREDGTIDVDLLKLDIDRSDEDAELTPDDMMVDAAIADAQAAEAEVEDAEIEAKVTPTADAAFLAGLTLEDLTIDDLAIDDLAVDSLDRDGLSVDEPNTDDLNIDDLVLEEATVEEQAEEEQTIEAGESTTSTSSTESETGEVDPQTDIDKTEAEQGQIGVEEETENDVELAAVLPDLGPLLTPDTEEDIALSKESEDEEIDNEESEIDSYFDLQNSEGANTDGLDVAADAQPEVVVESALTPDLPAEETEVGPPDAEDAPPSDELMDSLEADNQASVRNAVESEVDINELVSDLEEPIVSELPDEALSHQIFSYDDFGSRSAESEEILPADAEHIESALIPDKPADGTDGLDSPINDESDRPTPDRSTSVNTVQTEPVSTEPGLIASTEALPVEDFSTLSDSIENLPPTGVEDLLVDDTELLLSLGQPEVDGSPLLEDELDFSVASSIEDLPVDLLPIEEPTEELTAEDLLEEDSLADSLLAEDSLTEESPVEEPPIEDLSIEELPTEESLTENRQIEEPIEQPNDGSFSEAASAAASMSAASLLIEPPVELPVESRVESPSEPLNEPSSEPLIEPAVEPAEEPAEEPALQSVDDDIAAEDASKPADWFLGIDLGTTGLSAVLMERRSHRMYELCWSVAGDSEANRFRLPAVASIDTKTAGQLGLDVVGPAALQQEDAPLLRSLKPMVKAGIPDDFSGEPWMQWSDNMSLPLMTLQTAIADLLRTLGSNRMSCHAVGLKDAALGRALSNLQGVIVGYPTNWPDTYSFNIREAVLAAGLVTLPDQIFFVEDVIAALLSALPAPGMDISSDNQQPGLYNCVWSGGTVIVSAGATITEIAIADLPRNLAQLSYFDFASRSYAYAGDSIDQDIVCQLLHLPVQNEKSQAGSEESSQANDEIPTSSVQDSSPSANTNWESLGLNQLKLPRPGEADRIIRHRLRQRLNDSVLGRQALAAAQDLKMMLQEDEEVDVQLGDRTWVITRKELETKVFAPYIQRLNRLSGALLNQRSLSAQSVKQVICTGGAASLGAISDWLRQQFPNATIIQDTYSGEYSNSCSRVAYGLANLCHYPDVLDANRHRYNDYFLLLELLRTLPEQPLPAGGIMHLLAQRGVDVQACQTHLLALIEGHLPPGLVPTESDRPLISAQSSDIENYRLLAELPLFRKQGGQIYVADSEQGERLRTHLESLLTTKAQSLDQPMEIDAISTIVSAT